MLHITIPGKTGALLSRQELALVAVTAVWGVTFLVVHTAMLSCGPLFFVGVRFVTAGAIGFLAYPIGMRGLTRRELKAGVAIGVAIFLGYSLQTFGLKTISSSLSAFFTALYVPVVPLLEWMVLKRLPRLMSWIGIGLASAGLVLLAAPDTGSIRFSIGEIATLVAAIAMATEVILIGRFAGEVNARRVTVVQLLTAGLLGFGLMPVLQEPVPAFSWVWLSCAIGMGVISSIIQLVMNWAQRSVSPTRATLIYAGEPVWGGLAGRVAGDRIPALGLFGAALIVTGVIASELKWRRKPVGDPASLQADG